MTISSSQSRYENYAINVVWVFLKVTLNMTLQAQAKRSNLHSPKPTLDYIPRQMLGSYHDL